MSVRSELFFLFLSYVPENEITTCMTDLMDEASI